MENTDGGGVNVTCAIPPQLDSYWTLDVPFSGDHDRTHAQVKRFAQMSSTSWPA